MEKQFCYKCGKVLNYQNEDDCWSNAFHVPFDTLQKIKTIMKNNCICTDCLEEIVQQNKQK